MRWLVWMVVGCGGSGDDGDDGDNDVGGFPYPTDTDPDGSGPLPEPTSDLVLEQRHNLDLDVTLALPHAAVPEAADVTFDWEGLTTDVLGRPFAAGAVQQVMLLAVDGSADQVRAGIARAALEPLLAEGSWWLDGVNGRTRVQASELSATGHFFQPSAWFREENGYTFLVLLLDEDLTMLSGGTLAPPGSDTTLVIDDSARLTWTASLGEPLVTAPDLGPWDIDWSALTQDASGNAFDPLYGERLFVAKLTAVDADGFSAAALDPEGAAEAWWLRYIAGKSTLSTTDLTDFEGGGFPGFTPTAGTWVVGLRCTSCITPIPQVVAHVRVVDE